MDEDEIPLREEDIDPDPFRQFERWFDDAVDVGASQPEAAAVATATPEGAPSVRMVLFKRTGREGFVFFSNYESRKGRELAANPRASLMFHWEPLGRVVRIEGPVARTTREESVAYAHSRGRGSQLSALASPQSQPIPSREWLEERAGELAGRYPPSGEIPVSDSWGGYRVEPERFEFWQHRISRMHDRLVYMPASGGGWKVERLAP
ncbi:MAG TPA: pyridoxamine 5'-phosphate oxidase [Solirubrobacteraceae bacterium]|nr:pyridoxamine 5'-phosphate oxidase [Solirubrobacteraceae bacterium]